VSCYFVGGFSLIILQITRESFFVIIVITTCTTYFFLLLVGETHVAPDVSSSASSLSSDIIPFVTEHTCAVGDTQAPTK
jgi:hypothetical protein